MAVNEIPDAGSFDANCESLKKNIEEHPDLMLHSFSGKQEFTACGIPVSMGRLSVTPGAYFIWAARAGETDNYCFNCESIILNDLCDDFITRYKQADEKFRGLTPGDCQN